MKLTRNSAGSYKTTYTCANGHTVYVSVYKNAWGWGYSNSINTPDDLKCSGESFKSKKALVAAIENEKSLGWTYKETKFFRMWAVG